MPHSTYPERDYNFGQQILALRTASNLTQIRLAERLGISRQAIVGWEAGSYYPSPQHLKYLIELFLQYGAFHQGEEIEEIRALWESANQRMPLDETWLVHLLAQLPNSPATPHPSEVGSQPPALGPHVDWGDAPDVSNFYGRETELALLTDWLLEQRCRVVSLLGMGGMGKTSLAARLVQQAAPGFERVYWRSLRDAPPPGEWLSGAIGFLSDQHQVPPAADSERLAALLELLRTRRCLLVLDNFDTLFEPEQAEGRYRTGLEGYGHLLQTIGEAAHQSCLLLTSREAPAELAILGGEAVRIFPLGGLGVNEARLVLASKQLAGNSEQWAELVAHSGGNPLALKLVGERIRELFDGEIGLYLEEAGVVGVFGGAKQILAEQVGRSSAPERQVLRALAVARERVRLADLLAALGSRLGRGTVLEAVEALLRRSLLERVEAGGRAAFTLQSVVLEYVTGGLVEAAAEEIARCQPALLIEQALIQAQARDYVRQGQERLIGLPILTRLKAHYGQERTEQLLLAQLEAWRGRPRVEQGYGPGNVVNLLRLLRGNLRRLNLSKLALRQAHLADVDAQDASLVGAYLADVVLAEAFSLPVSLVLSRFGGLLAAGTASGQVWLWQIVGRKLVAVFDGHTSAVWGMALSPNGRLLASGGEDGTIRLWDTSTGQALAILHGHTGVVYSVAMSIASQLLASGGTDGTVRLWNISTGSLLATLPGHTSVVWGVALSADGRLLASGSADGTVRLWETSPARPMAVLSDNATDVRGLTLSHDGRFVAGGGMDGIVRLWDASTGRLLASLEGHSGAVWGLAQSADGQLLASSGVDGTARLWDAGTGRQLLTLQGHTGIIRSMALSDDGRLLASGGLDGTVRLWETGTGRPVATLQGNTNVVWGVAMSTSGQLLASGGLDGTVWLWETETGRLLATLQGYADIVWCVALSADGQLLASSSVDGTVRLWETATGQTLATLQGHTGAIWGLALSADGRLLASSSEDGTVRLWETDAGRLLGTLEGHAAPVWGLALAADGRFVASGGTDGTMRLWEVPSGRPLATLQGYTGVIRCMALSADGRLLASGGTDGMVRLWETSTGRLLENLQGHTSGIWGIALSADGRLLASSSGNGTVRLWDASTGRSMATLQGHRSAVRGVALSADGRLLASGSWDGTVKLWDTQTGVNLRTLRPERRYERLNFTGLIGITDAQRQALLALGAVEDEESIISEQLVFPRY